MPLPVIANRRRSRPLITVSVIRRVGSASATSAAASSVTIHYTATTGNFLFVAVAGDLGSFPTVSDGVNTYSQIGFSSFDFELFYAENITGGALSIVCGGSNSTALAAQVLEISGAGASSPILASSAGHNTGGTISSGATTAGVAANFVVGVGLMVTASAVSESLTSPTFTPGLNGQTTETPVSVLGSSSSSNILISSGPIASAVTESFSVVGSTSGALGASATCVLMQVQPPSTPPTRVGYASATAAGATSVTVNYTATTGNMLLVVCAGVVGASLSVSDGTNTYTSLGSASFDVNAFYAKNITGGSLSIVCSGGGSAARAIAVLELAGASTTSPIHYQVGHTQTGGSMTSTATGTGTSTDYVVGMCALATGAAVSESLTSPAFTSALSSQNNETPAGVVGTSTSANVLISDGPIAGANTETFTVSASTGGATAGETYCVVVH